VTAELTRPWFERWPDLLAWELERFDQLGLPASVDKKARANGQLIIASEVAFKGEKQAIRAVYPSEYPELPPTLFGEPGLLERHQHWFGGNFCLLPRPLDDWPARSWGAADLISERLRALLADSEAGPDQVRANEAPMPEPVSSYFVYALDAAVLFPQAISPGGSGGQMRLRRAAPHLLVVEETSEGRATQGFLGLFPAGKAYGGLWKRLEEAPRAGADPTAIAKWIRKEHPNLLERRPPPRPPRSRGRGRPGQPQFEFCALVFPEEGPGVGETRDGWLFLAIDRSAGAERAALIHCEMVSSEERGRRLGELEGLAEKRVVVLGLGTIGSPIAVELARTGVGRLELIDCERFEFGNTTRHALGVEYVGLPKATAVAVACRRANPFAAAGAHYIRLGDPAGNGKESSLERLVPLLESADLVVDATGSHQIAQLIGRLAAELEMPMVSAWMTEGFWGAEVVRVVPGKTCCWTCFVTAHREERLLRALAGPPSEVATQGCSHPTTIGPGFDALEVAANAVRLGVQTLSPLGGYPDCGWDHATLSFRRDPDDAEFPRFAVESLPPSSGCQRCQTVAGAITGL
jgi:molybdopterin/thiamine biosynthesis adenylyltransferase